MEKRSLDEIIKNNLNSDQLKQFNKIYYGKEEHSEIKFKKLTLENSEKYNFEVKGYKIDAAEETRAPRIVRIGLIQHSIVLPTDKPILEQKEAIFDKVGKIIDTAASEGVQIVCLQELWYMPFFLCTREKSKWADFAESATEGQSILFLKKIAKKYKIVIISSILEDDNGTWWNTAVVVNEEGNYMGKHRKNHLPSTGSFNETMFYSPGNLGHAVFDTKYGKIAINICYGRHQALNWLMFAVNGAEIVFNPAGTVPEFGESFWGIEARNAAIANHYFTCSINRVGTETFIKENKEITRNYYGSSYVTAPTGYRTPGLSKNKDGLMITEIDLNLCRQVKDHWGFTMTARLDLYANELNEVTKKYILCFSCRYSRNYLHNMPNQFKNTTNLIQKISHIYATSIPLTKGMNL